MRASAFALIVASVAFLSSGTAEAQGRRARFPGFPGAAAGPAYTGSVPAWGPNSDRRLVGRGGGTIHWNTGNEWGNLGGPGTGGGGGGGQ